MRAEYATDRLRLTGWARALWGVLVSCSLLPATPRAYAGDELSRYVARADASYALHLLHSGQFAGADYLEAILTSQTWHGTAWRHQLFVVKPRRLDVPATQALLFIDGGSWESEYDSTSAHALPREAGVFVRLANALRAPVAIVRQVPFEPLFDGRREDALIAYTFEQYLDTGDPDWPLLLPMVKSAARAMDAVQELARQQWGLSIARFTVTGASKRGWTAWLTAAVDSRVAGVAPMVIDMLDIKAQIQLQRQTFGGLSEQIQEYEQIRLPERIDSPTGRELVSIVDPYSYRDRLTQPKLIFLGTNDPYWPLDALNVYWGGLAGEKRVLYLPNQPHDLRDVDRLIGGLAALNRYSARDKPLPEISANFSEQSGRLELAVHSDRTPQRVLAWSARSATRDFHKARWSSHACSGSGGSYECEERTPGDAYTALYAEAMFQDPDAPAFSLSTTVSISAPATGTLSGPLLTPAQPALGQVRR
jgi:PhoPQ-activated pathogenicity-related protein